MQEELDLEGYIWDTDVTTRGIEEFSFLAQDHYSQFGDIDAAKKYAKSQIKQTYKTSAVTSEEMFMKLPPEKFFPSLEPSAMREILISDVATAVPEDIDASSISIVSDEVTDDTRRWIVTGKHFSGGSFINISSEVTAEDL